MSFVNNIFVCDFILLIEEICDQSSRQLVSQKAKATKGDTCEMGIKRRYLINDINGFDTNGIWRSF